MSHSFLVLQKKDLDDLETLTRISHKVTSKLDSDSYFQPLGEGSFGQVYKAQRKGQAVAVKMLKNIESIKQIENFEREVDTLRCSLISLICCIYSESESDAAFECLRV